MATHVLACRADSDAPYLDQSAARHQLTLPSPGADVRPAYVEARPRGRHSVAEAMRREGLAWEPDDAVVVRKVHETASNLQRGRNGLQLGPRVPLCCGTNTTPCPAIGMRGLGAA